MTRIVRIGLGAIGVAMLVAGCGGGASKEAAPAQTPASQPQPGYGAPRGESTEAPPRAPADEAPESGASPGRAPESLPGSMKSEERRREPLDEMEALTRRLEGTLTLLNPDCATAWSLRDRICDLADRICNLASRSAERDVAERCSDGRSRCERATSRVRESCGR